MARLILVSNRVPVPAAKGNGRAGGLEVALRSVFKRHPGVWFGWSGSVVPNAEAATETIERADSSYVLTDLSDEDYQEFYNGFANRVLWPILHYRLDLAEFTRRDLTGYMRVNAHFASELSKLIRPDDIIWVHDYHFIPLGHELRRRGHENRIGFFLHIPWPGPDSWRVLPSRMRRELLTALLHADRIGFQTERDTRHFLQTCVANLPEVRVTRPWRQLSYEGRQINAAPYPISIDVEAVRKIAHGKEARSYDRYLPNYLNEYTVLRVDRAEPSKNIIRGFQAFGRFLEAHPEFLGRVNFMAILVPSRMDVEEYQDYLDDVSAIVGRINAKYANVETGWQPIHLIMGENYPRALAAMRWYDVLMVNTIIDGMNLVAKEGCLLNERNGVLILSEGAGAAIQLGDDALMISPADVEGTADAIYQAFTMPQAERRRRAENLRRAVEGDDVAKCFREQLWDIVRYSIKGERDPGSVLPDGSVVSGNGRPAEEHLPRVQVVVSAVKPGS